MRSETLLGALVGDGPLEALFTDTADLAAQLKVEAALAEAEAEHGLIEADAAPVIAGVCADFTPDTEALARTMAQDGVPIPGLVRQLRGAVGDRYGSSVHRGATSQDIVDTSLVLRLADAIGIFEDRMRRVQHGLAALERRDGALGLMGHTRMQVALPMRVRDKLASWRAPLVRHQARLAELKPRLLVLQLGGPVGTRAELGPHADAIVESTATCLGLAAGPCWQSQRDTLGEFGSWLSLVAGTLGKIGQDVALLAQNEVGAVKLAGGGTSSAMAHKQNPVAAETLVTLARFNAGMLGALHQCLVHENERSGAAWTLEWMTLPQMVVATGSALRIAADLLDNLTFIERPELP